MTIRMPDESKLPDHAIGYCYNPSFFLDEEELFKVEGYWTWWSIQPEVGGFCFLKKAEGQYQMAPDETGTIPDEHAPTEIPEDWTTSWVLRNDK